MTREPCDEFVTLIARAAEGDLDEELRDGLDAHVRTCAVCRDALAAQTLVRSALAARPRVRAAAGFHARVMQAIEARVPWFERWDFRRWSWRLAPLAAALVIAVYSVAASSQSGQSTTETSSVETTAVTATATLPVSAALWSDSVSDTSVLSLMLAAHADDLLADHLKDK